MEVIEFDHFSSFYIDAAGVLRKNKPWLHPTRNWDIVVLAYMDKGSMVLYEDGAELNITDQTFYVLFPNRTHYATAVSSGQLQLPWIHLIYHRKKPKTVSHMPLVYSSEIPFSEESYGKIYIPSFWKVQNPEYVKSKFLEAYQLQSKKDPYSHSRAILTVMEILMHLSTEYSAALRSGQFDRNRTYLLTKKMVEYIGANWQLNPTVEQLADVMGITPGYLIRTFKANLGMTPLRYMTFLRIDKAKELLSQSELSIKQITAEIGLDDPYYFSRLFKKQTGMTPTEFRLKSYQD
ncbi:AraC family transcriptional regulator [Paenibacillus sp.]|uniref:helix-turn-helix domain-containing protein n=1 Tax=Paenibacillus sp. TaxID=58172 RepID=UPI002D57BC49|nr:AraC family transcriptional regulator [Paenibacillus sp.]HZG86022.1 AraC family transcriptional regulator [Paenibacillus sp.]